MHPAAMSCIKAERSVQLAHAFAGCPTGNDRPARQLPVGEAHLRPMVKMQVLTDGMDQMDDTAAVTGVIIRVTACDRCYW